MWITFLNYPKKTYKNIYFLPISIMIVPKMRKIVIQSVDNFYGICLFSYFYLNPVWWSLFSSTGRVCLRPTAFAGPKSRKSDHQTYFNLKLAKINKFHNGRRITAGSVSGLRASQGQSREKVTTKPTLI